MAIATDGGAIPEVVIDNTTGTLVWALQPPLEDTEPRTFYSRTAHEHMRSGANAAETVATCKKVGPAQFAAVPRVEAG